MYAAKVKMHHNNAKIQYSQFSLTAGLQFGLI